MALALAAHERDAVTMENLLRWTSLRSPRTVLRHLQLVADACGEEPISFIRDVIDRRRSTREWFRALELHGGRLGA